MALLLPTATPASAAGGSAYYPASATLDGRTTMSLSNHAYPDLVPSGMLLRVLCQVRGPVAYGSAVWDVVATAQDGPAGGRPVLVVDRYVRTGHTGFSPKLPRCSSSDLAALRVPRRQPTQPQEPVGLKPPPPDDVVSIGPYLGWSSASGSCDRNSSARADEGERAVDPNQHASFWQTVRETKSSTGGVTTTTQQQRGVSRARVYSWCTNRAQDGSVLPHHALYRSYSPTEYSFRLRYFSQISSENGRTAVPWSDMGVGADRDWTVGDGLRPEN